MRKVIPGLLGAGIPFFPVGFPQRDFKLVASKAYGQGGFLDLTYARARHSSRKAVIGSTSEARRAGTYAARIATISMSGATSP